MKPKLIDINEMKIIDSILNKWSGKLTWDNFAITVASALNRPSISKFTLMGYEPIKQAFNFRKKTLREAKSKIITSANDVTIDMLIRENEDLRNQIKHLEELLKDRENVWVEQYRRWQYNLSQMPQVDLSKLDLDKPLLEKK